MDEVEEKDHIITYVCGKVRVMEAELADTISFSKPEDRLLSGQVDEVRVFDLRIEALQRRDGTTIWSNDALLRRGLSAPALDGDAVVVADFEGYLHWLDRGTGALLARVHPKKGTVTNAPVAVDGMVYLQTDGGRVYAYTTKPNGRAAEAAEAKPVQRPPANLPADLSPVGR